jgi:hypothetical protein
MDRSLSDAQIEYYSRQILLRELGGTGQKRLLGAACLLVGEGAATAVAASYLAGAGIGRLDVLASAEAAPGEGGSALAPLEERNPDVAVHRLGAAPPRLEPYDASIVEADVAPRLAGIPGRPRHGEIRIEVSSAGETVLVLVPAGAAGCALCTTLAGGASIGRPAPAEPAAPEMAGALAALAVCRWVAGLAGGATAVAWRLGPGAPTWEEVAVSPSGACPRGCRS